jgi:hypothetical protein
VQAVLDLVQLLLKLAAAVAHMILMSLLLILLGMFVWALL